jgi:hypothetical protein
MFWWTRTAKSIAVAGIVLGMKFVDSSEFVHGNLKPSSLRFHENQKVQIVDIDSSGLESCESENPDVTEMRNDEAERDTKTIDVFSFASILFKILVECLLIAQKTVLRMADISERVISPGWIPEFISDLIES